MQRATQALMAGAIANNDKLATDAANLVSATPITLAGDQRHQVHAYHEDLEPREQATDLIRTVQDELYLARLTAKHTERFDPAISALTSCSRVYKAALQEKVLAERAVHNRLYYVTHRHPTVAALAMRLLDLKG